MQVRADHAIGGRPRQGGTEMNRQVATMAAAAAGLIWCTVMFALTWGSSGFTAGGALGLGLVFAVVLVQAATE